MSKFIALFSVLFVIGCQPDLYSPEGWPRAVVIESQQETDTEILQVEVSAEAVDQINEAVGAAVYQLAVTNDMSKAGCDTARIRFVDRIWDDKAEEWDDRAAGMWYVGLNCWGDVQLKTGIGVKTATHELLHALGLQHDDNPISVMFSRELCYKIAKEKGYGTTHCETVVEHRKITAQNIAAIRQLMGLKD